MGGQPGRSSLVEEANSRFGHRAHCTRKRAFDVDAAARTGHDRDFEPCPAPVDRRIKNAEIGGEAAHCDTFKSAFLQITTEPRRRATVVFEERRIGVDLGSEALSQHELGMRDIEAAMEGRSGRSLYTVIRPQDLPAIKNINRVERLFAGM